MNQTFHHMRRGLIQVIFTYQLNQILRVLLISFRRVISITVWSRLSVILMGMFFVFSGCEEQVNEEMTVINLPLLDLSIIRICSDGEDNDGDDLIDLDDPGCVGELDDDEFNLLPPTECSDQVDNDNDGLVDLDDPACLDPRGEDESNDPPLPECQNQIDDDQDGYVDYPSDPGCQTAGDEDEGDDPPPSECQNQIDDDQDGYADYPFDPGCASPEDDDERDDTMFSNIPQCNNGLDDDRDGYADLADVDCLNLTDPRERVIEGDPIPVCANDLDDDEDGYIDFPQDIGCSSAGSSSEVDPPELPHCGNSLDDDGDGYLDYPDDPGCVGRGDRDEGDPPVRPDCLDGEDNDADGVIDYPKDVGCTSASDISEEGWCGIEGRVIELNDGDTYRGNSRQGRFEREGQCGGRGAPELTFLFQVREPIKSITFTTRAIPPMVTQEGEEIEEERGWETVMYVWRRCNDPTPELACVREPLDEVAYNRLQIDQPEVGPLYLMVDGASGRGGSFEFLVEVTPIEECQNGIDDDEDGVVDFPNDSGCESFLDPTEDDPDVMLECSDGLDNDEDGLVDYPLDIGCRAASDPDELDECGQGVIVYSLGEAPLRTSGDSTQQGSSSEFQGVCRRGDGIEQVFLYENPTHASLNIRLNRLDGREDFASLYARGSSCLDPLLELGCVSGEVGLPLEEMVGGAEPEGGDEAGGEAGVEERERDDFAGGLTLFLEDVPAGKVYIFVDHVLDGFPFDLELTRTPLPPICRDGEDNDGDGRIDGDDLGCEDSEDESELDPPVAPVCFDRQDNDQDGLIDYPLDPGCVMRGGGSEEDLERLTACYNNIDDNGDGYTDFPWDVGCVSRGDDSEAAPVFPPACSNLFDDDADGYTDFPNDPGCISRGDTSERDELERPQCDDDLDNDLNGIIDYPFDVGCYARGDDRERAPLTPPRCSDGLDNDLDDLIDLPYDPGCTSAGDDSESDPLITPACANGVDDDQNGRVDWPDDPGCIFRGDLAENFDENAEDSLRESFGEEFDGLLPPRCSDRIDNDDDGVIDLMDTGCVSRLDNDEEDPVELSQCSDQLDNDQDGEIDWPHDFGCSGLGDECEEGGYGLCRGAQGDVENPDQGPDQERVCVDLLTSRDHCGACEVRCEEGVECILGFCGGVAPIKSKLMYCGFTARPVRDFIRGALTNADLRVTVGCDPDEDTQAFLINRHGVAGFRQNLDLVKRYIFEGGQVITERGTSDEVYSALTGYDIFSGELFGECMDNIQPAVQWNPNDPIWKLVPFSPTPEQLTGCGHTLEHYPHFIRLGGWDDQHVSLGYLDIKRGRLWLVESDWQDNGDDMSEESLDLMSAMILGGGATPRSAVLPACMDGLDNDRDGAIDLFDSDCQARRDTDEYQLMIDQERSPECSDGVDNNQDGEVDFPYDPHCEGRGDFVEDLNEGSSVSPQCMDGLDNDQDGEIDWPYDSGCMGRGDLIEDHPILTPQCANFQDDDHDGWIDFPYDPECIAASMFSEEGFNSWRPQENILSRLALGVEVNAFGRHRRSACLNQVDDDQDGVVDFPYDSDCSTSYDQTEGAEIGADVNTVTPPPQCADGLDNDQNGQIDFPYDSGCRAAGDPSEVSFVVIACSDEVDNDQDGDVDYPSDLQCHSASDYSETETSITSVICRDGVDNDQDGQIDGADVGCETFEDTDELDPNENMPSIIPECADGVDNDQDGWTDWPDDLGCASLGSLLEDQSCVAYIPEDELGEDDELIEVIDLTESTVMLGSTRLELGQEEAQVSRFTHSCGGELKPERVYRYTLDHQATLRAHLIPEETDFSAILSIRRSCNLPQTEIACASAYLPSLPPAFPQESPLNASQGESIVIPHALPGEYYLFVDGSRPPTWESRDLPIVLPEDPQGYIARDDITSTCWSDAGGDTFDCMGRIQVIWRSQSLFLDVSLGNHVIELEDAELRYESELAHSNIWRLRFWSTSPTIEEEGIDIKVLGNLGSDQDTIFLNEEVTLDQNQLPYLYAVNDLINPTKAPVLVMMLPRDSSIIQEIDIETENDQLTIFAQRVKLPLTVYIAASYLPRLDLLDKITDDLDLYDGQLEASEPAGQFGLMVEEDTP